MSDYYDELVDLTEYLNENSLLSVGDRHQHEPSSDSDSDVAPVQFWRQPTKTSVRQPVKEMETCDLKLETQAKLGLDTTPTKTGAKRKRDCNDNILNILSHKRLYGVCRAPTKRRILSQYLPCSPSTVAQYHHKVFCGRYYGAQCDKFMTASQDCLIRLYDTSRGGFKHRHSIEARDVGWSVLDVAVSHAGDCLVYSSWAENLHCVSIADDTIDKMSAHVPLPLAPDDIQFCIFSVTFSNDDKEILGGSNDGCLYIYDRGSDQRTSKIAAHQADVNTVCFLDDNTNVLASGADDGLVKIWDRRSLHETSPVPVGEMAGHVDGITYVSPKGDGRYLISNSKDQSIKLWDLRRFSDQSSVREGLRAVSGQRWDYRWQRVPKYVSRTRDRVAGDSSVMTYTGHTVLQTLIRCHFSPGHTTGHRYIYTGCATGKAVIYDLISGDIVSELEGHGGCVRDVSWSEDSLNLVTCGWDGAVVQWKYHSDSHDTV